VLKSINVILLTSTKVLQGLPDSIFFRLNVDEEGQFDYFIVYFPEESQPSYVIGKKKTCLHYVVNQKSYK
jgi:hypothetical protein